MWAKSWQGRGHARSKGNNLTIITNSKRGDKIGIGIMKWKGTGSSPVDIFLQAACSAVNPAFQQYTFGLSLDEIMVPFVVLTGTFYQVGFVTFCETCFPVVNVGTDELRVHNDQEEIAKVLTRIKLFLTATAKRKHRKYQHTCIVGTHS